MMAKNGKIFVDRSILDWRWYKDANTFRVFMHLLLTANYAPSDFENIRLERGDVLTTYGKLSEQLDLTVQEVRTAMNHLKSTGELTGRQYAKYQVISILNYDLYQGTLTGKSTGNQQATNRQSTGNQQHSNKNNNNINNNIYISPYNPPLQGDYETTEKKAHGEYGNVLLTSEEFDKLAEAFPDSYLDAIKELDLLLEESDRNKKRYEGKKHYIVLQRKLGKIQKDSSVKKDDGRLTFDLDEIFALP